MELPTTSASTQRAAIVKDLRQHGSITTIYAREVLGIMAPAPRILELRAEGFLIVTHWTTSKDITGTKHREAKYVLMSEPNRKTQTTSVETKGMGFPMNKTDDTARLNKSQTELNIGV